jgi:imidazolonepropionase-like amidohydrolase
MHRPALCAATLACAALAPPLYAQPTTEPIETYALTNARIVVAPGRVIEVGTVILRDGRILAVGPDVQVPADALTLDLTGKTVYPGLIDVATAVGLPTIGGGGGRGGRGGGGGPAAPEPTGPPPEVRPDRMAANEYTATEEDREAWRRAGVTTLGLAFDGGIFPGQTAAVSLAPSGAGTFVLRTPVSQQVLLGRRRGGYPGTLMGALAYVEQAFLDAQHAVTVEEAFARNPASAPRPTYDPEHRALAAAVRGDLPVWFHAEAKRDLGRVIDLAERSGIVDFALVGAQEGYLAIDELRAAGKPVIVSLDWPSPGTVTGRAHEMHVAPVSGEDEAGAEADSAAAHQLRANAAALADAGITIALSGHGLASPAEFRRHVLAAVEAGLAPDAALRALTVTPAQLLGLQGLVGTIENGKLANLVITDGDLFTADARIRHVFVEGRRHDIPDEPAPQADRRGGPGEAADAVSAAGTWAGAIDMPGATMQFTMTLTDSAGTLAGTIDSEAGSVEVSGERTGDSVLLQGSYAPPGQTAMALAIAATIDDGVMSGTLTLQGQAPIEFSARLRGPGSGASREGGTP